MSEWKKVKLGDCIKEINEKTTKNNQYRVLSVTKEGIFSQEEFFKKQIASKNNIGYKIIRKNNLVFSTMNLWMGSLDVLTNYDIGIVSPSYKTFEFNENLMIPKYGNYFMKSYYMLEQYKNCSEQGASVVRRNLDLKALLNIEINIPSIEEQEKIVKILKNIDYIIEKYKNVLEEKDKFIKSQFSKMFYFMENSKFSKQKIESLVDRNIISIKKKYNKEDLINYIDISSINKEKHTINSITQYIVKDAPSRAQQCLKKNDILISTVRPNLKNIAILKENIPNAVASSGFCILRCNENCNYQYLFNIINTDKFTNDIVLKTTGSNYPAIRDKDVLEYFVPVPPIELQRQFEKIVEIIDQQKLLLEQQKQDYEKLKKALMQKLLTGKVRVKI